MGYERRSVAAKFFIFSLLWGGISSCIILLLVKIGISTEVVFALKDMPIYVVALAIARMWLMQKHSILLAILVLLFFFLLLFNYRLLNPSYPAAINNIRQILAPLLLLLVFCRLRICPGEERGIEHFFLIFIIFVFSFGLFEQVFQLWPKVNLTRYFELKGIPTDSNGVSFMFYEPMLNYRERMTSIFLDPISAGHCFATAAIYIYYRNKKFKSNSISIAALFCSLLGVMLTLSKGALLQLFIGLLVLNPFVNALIRAASISIPYIVLSLIDNKDGILIHVSGFSNSISNVNIWGYGIGTAGNYTKMFGDSNALAQYSELGISDTYVGSIIGQIGLIGIFLWIFIAILIIKFSSKGRPLAPTALKIFLSIFIVSVLSENTMNVTSFLIPATIIGLCLRTSNPIYNAQYSHDKGVEALAY